MSAYFRRSCFCSHRLFVFKEWDKSIFYFCPTIFCPNYSKISLNQHHLAKSRFYLQFLKPKRLLSRP
ncbi:hypothetical protein [Enterococcus durans]|uniref:hypothetical protein n=1 Tax=Enterococcus durans TaxID=53345 RepID=UPI0039839A8B